MSGHAVATKAKILLEGSHKKHLHPGFVGHITGHLWSEYILLVYLSPLACMLTYGILYTEVLGQGKSIFMLGDLHKGVFNPG